MWLDTLIAYSLQVAVVIAAGMLLPAVFRVRQPSARLAWLQGVFAACLLVPLWQPWAGPLAQPLAQPLVEIQVYTTGIVADQASGSWRWLDLIAGVLCAGVAVRWFWLALGLLRLRRYRASAERLSPVPSVIARLQTRLGVQPEFYLSSELASPLTFGIRPAVVLLPTRFAGMPEETQEAIVCHELCHVRRRDWLVTFAEETVRGLFWFHPFVVWLIREMQLAREQMVDRQVVEITGSRQAYVAALIEIASARVHPAMAMAPLFLRKRQITRRVQMLAQEVSMSRVRLAVSLAMMGTILAGTGQFSAWSFPLQGAGPGSAEIEDVVAEKAKAFADAWDRAKQLHPLRDENTSRPKKVMGVTPPRVLHTVDPEYTGQASAAKLSGTVVLYLEVGIDGQPRNIRVARGLGMGLDEKAVEAVQRWRFSPGEKDGKPVSVGATIEIAFRLPASPAGRIAGVFTVE